MATSHDNDQGFTFVPADCGAHAPMAAPMGGTTISLGQLAYTCRVYDTMTDYGRSLRSFRQAVDGGLDLADRGHTRALFDWLNAWACRIDTSVLKPMGEDLAAWFGQHRLELPSVHDRLLGSSDAALEAIIEPFDRLSGIKPPDSRRSFGPTAASKTLFALSPAVFVPWDLLIRQELVRGSSGAAYALFLKRMRDNLGQIAEQCSKGGLDLEMLPEMMGRPGSTAAQLIGEYHWVTITRGAQPPDSETLHRWAAWSLDSQ